MAELRIGGAFLAALGNYTQDVSRVALEAGNAGISAYQNSIKEAARGHERWEGIAEYIESWEEDGQLLMGVRDPRASAAAINAEYGDAEHPPVPILRANHTAQKAATEAMDRKLGEAGWR